ncbi:PBSX family phage terminase large subunit [Rhodococcoides fascians]|uniref:PBSX family phage terminase large subunit n=1 Tax=Rhodococcoides fascians TaxID=1828 RepID=UPI00068ACE52|nr:PBSX family phage terminase large subunit [Rhodococcus fascians]
MTAPARKPAAMSPKQQYAIIAATGRVNIFEGSIRAGKTFSWLMIMLDKIKNAGPEGSIIIVGKNRDAIYRNVFEPIESIPAFAEFAKEVHYRQGAATAIIYGRKVHCIGANDAKSENRIRGMSVQQVYLDEITVLDQSFFKQALGRMSIPGAQMFGTTNPDTPAHFLKKDYLDRIGVPDDQGKLQLTNWRRFHFNIEDNPSLEEEYKASLYAEYTGLWYRRFILGHWVAAEGAVYDMWDQERHVVPWEKLPAMTEYFGVGIDYGTTNATSAILLGLGQDGVLYAVDEWRYAASSSESRKTDSQLSEGIREWLTKPHLPAPHGNPDIGPVIVDPAAASFRVQMKADGVHTYPASNEVLYGIRLLANLLEKGKLKVSSKCRGLIQEFPGYSWDPKQTDNGKDYPITKDDHGLDSLRYVCSTTEKRWRRKVDLTSDAVSDAQLAGLNAA